MFAIDTPELRRRVTAAAPFAAEYGLRDCDLRRRVFAIDRNGRVRSGLDAMAAIWRELPRRRWAARLVRAPVLGTMLDVGYEALLVPALAAWNRRRARQAAPKTAGRPSRS